MSFTAGARGVPEAVCLLQGVLLRAKACWHSRPCLPDTQDTTWGSHSCLRLAQAHRLHSAEQAQAEYDKKKKKFKPTADTVFNQKALYNAYEVRSQSGPYPAVGPHSHMSISTGACQADVPCPCLRCAATR